ncbi:WD40 repeat-like protein [Patellaria atrata CBS 101060]|uniref:WD40 repeat-like protein n=1 Tax=Patellaria atrata CBS 101060 TaxID=1346257 RepID=A0A9P4SA23_9PEZI|nr:WD40 repeat-like protein [Patellaria atrata CBS 101060]
MKYTLLDRLLRRELGGTSRYSHVCGVYGDRNLIDDLDIVNELKGHTGCVNALCWSKSGRLLASGSDDQNVNIHSYLPESSTSQFQLTTQISTGHGANVFSVKFMPYSNDQTIVTAAGDGEVRIFDLEYSGRSSTSRQNASGSSRRGRALNNVYNSVQYLTEGDTNAKVFRSHGDRVKRIVTESSPYHFLTCSEDGEVRQWDTRLPSSAYPRPGSRSDYSVPPPLISYKRYRLDLNTISCSPSQPHYIALGGAHLHCFLHDRRMLGRDRSLEAGLPTSYPRSDLSVDDESMAQATQCVRRFAPNGVQRMKPGEHGHITACKISDYNPNELIVSWSGDWIYSFDILRSPDARESRKDRTKANGEETKITQLKQSRLRKRKRDRIPSRESLERAGSRPRTESIPSADADEDISLMIQYGNGQSEEIPIGLPRSRSSSNAVSQIVMSQRQVESMRIAKTSVKIRQRMFALEARGPVSASDPTGYGSNFTGALGFCASILPDMDEIHRTWPYPINPEPLDVAVHKKLRIQRESSRRFVQAAGTLARALGGKLRTGGNSQSIISEYFTQIVPAPNEGLSIPKHEQFGYDFIKAILLWVDSGVGSMLEGFSRPSHIPLRHPRFPVPADASLEAIEDFLIPYLLELATDRPVPRIDTSRFEVDENHVLFQTEKDAVLTFASAIRLPFEDLSAPPAAAHDLPAYSERGETHSEHSITTLNRLTTLKFWGLEVARGLLMTAGEGVNFSFMDSAFGGLGHADEATQEIEDSITFTTQRVDPVEEPQVQEISFVRRPRRNSNEIPVAESSNSATRASPTSAPRQPTVEDADEDENVSSLPPPGTASTHDPLLSTGEERVDIETGDPNTNEAEAEAEDDSNGNENDNDDDDEDGDYDFWSQSEHGTWESTREDIIERQTLRSMVDIDKPCDSHTRVYRGHCNAKTVKDVNFFGLQDEYVVSGSDSGHLFIWDKKTSQIVNILEGDGEVVNVVQGHPYEPLIAVSGIDHTIKIFSPDARARRDARHGIIKSVDPSNFSSLGTGRTRGSSLLLNRRPSTAVRATASNSSRSERQTNALDSDQDSDYESSEEEIKPGGLESRKRLHQEYEITSRNDVERRTGGGDAYITRSMLAQLAQHIQARTGNQEGAQIVLEQQDCSVM